MATEADGGEAKQICIVNSDAQDLLKVLKAKVVALSSSNMVTFGMCVRLCVWSFGNFMNLNFALGCHRQAEWN